MGVTQCLLRSTPAFDKDVLSPTLFNYIIDWILRQALQDYLVVQVEANVHVSDLTYADDIVILSSSYSEDQGDVSTHHWVGFWVTWGDLKGHLTRKCLL